MTLKLEKRIQIALPVRIAVWSEGTKPVFHMGCTYDISLKGARLTGFKGVTAVGDILLLERAKNKALYRVMWVGKPGSPQQGQIGVQCIEPEKLIWEANLGELEEQYEPILAGMRDQLASDETVQIAPGVAKAEVFSEGSGQRKAKGDLVSISHQSCHVKSTEEVPMRSSVQVLITADAFDIRMLAYVRASDVPGILSLGLRDIRRGDRRSLEYLMAHASRK